MTAIRAARAGSISAQEVEHGIYEAVAKLVELQGRTLTPETDLRGLGLSSLELVTLAFELEDRWTISIPNEMLGDFLTVAEARDVVLEIMAKNGAAR
jgi:acyl carrier protein